MYICIYIYTYVFTSYTRPHTYTLYIQRYILTGFKAYKKGGFFTLDFTDSFFGEKLIFICFSEYSLFMNSITIIYIYIYIHIYIHMCLLRSMHGSSPQAGRRSRKPDSPQAGKMCV